MHRAIGAIVLLLAVGLLPSVGAGPGDAAAPAAIPCDARWMDDVGWVCDTADGMLALHTADGDFLGFLHGPDPVPEGAAPIEAPGEDVAVSERARHPQCANSSYGSQYAIQIIYARAYNDADRFDALRSTLINQVLEANGLLHDEGVQTGAGVDLRFRCIDGFLDIRNEVLPTSKGAANFGSIIEDLRNLGYTSGRVKHWVFYDDPGACGCAGQGSMYVDDRASTSNWNNGNGGALFGVNFGYDWTVGLHELGHNMGAVQDSAPHSTRAGHCFDGRDIMCYDDDGPRGNLYSGNYCSGEPFDCNHDDYFHANPARGSYLANYWNIAHQRNRFIKLNEPEHIPGPGITLFSCPTQVDVQYEATCTLRIDEGAGKPVWAFLDWGDGTGVQRLPASGTWSAGSTHAVTHTYSQTGSMSLQLDAHASTGTDAATHTIEVRPDGTPPEVVIASPLDGHIYVGCSRVTPFASPAQFNPTFIDRGCISLSASDPAGVAWISIALSTGDIIYQASNGPTSVTRTFDLPSGQGDTTIMIRVTDGHGVAASINIPVRYVS